MTSFAQRISHTLACQNIFLVTGGKDSSGVAAWYYVQVESHQKPRFDRAIRSGAMTLTDYGNILRSGYGETPPEHVRADMKQRYGYEG